MPAARVFVLVAMLGAAAAQIAAAAAPFTPWCGGTGEAAADLVHEGRFGRMAALQGNEIVDVPLADAVAQLKTVPPQWYEVARAFFG